MALSSGRQWSSPRSLGPSPRSSPRSLATSPRSLGPSPRPRGPSPRPLVRLQGALAKPASARGGVRAEGPNPGGQPPPLKEASGVWTRASEEQQKSTLLVESGWFQGIVGVVIFINAIVIGVELEVDFEGWAVVEFLLLLFFTVELCLRICSHGWDFFTTGGNLFDFLIVLSGIMDSWIIPTSTWVFSGRRQKGGGFLSETAQLLRMLRIFRLVRLVKIIQPLYRLALGIAEAVQGMFWVLVFLMMMLYGAAILCTRLLGHGDVPGLLNDEEDEDSGAMAVREMFHSVQSSMFVLFEMMSCWSLMRFVPLFRVLPLTRLLAVLFYILMAWALLAVMTGVVSEKMIAVKEAMNREEMNRDQVRRHIAGEKLHDFFRKVDRDGSGTITREEFNAMLLSTSLSKVLMEFTQVTTEELTEVFDWLDQDRNGSVDIPEFIRGFTWLNEQVSPKSFLKFQEDASRTIRRLEKRLVRAVNRQFDNLVAQVEVPMRKLSVAADQLELLEVALKKAERQLEKIPNAFFEWEPGEGDLDVNAVEDRLADRIEDLLVAVDCFEERYED